MTARSPLLEEAADVVRFSGDQDNKLAAVLRAADAVIHYAIAQAWDHDGNPDVEFAEAIETYEAAVAAWRQVNE